MNARSTLSLLACLAPALAGCTLSVPLLTPKPNIDLPKSAQAMRLDLGTGVGDTFDIPAQNGVRQTKVDHWHQTLWNGFNSGFGDSFPVSTQADSPLALELTDASPELIPAAVSGYYGVVAVSAQIRYKARILQSQNIVCRSNGTAVSKNSVNDPNQIRDVVRSAVESMYEVIAKECLEHQPPPAKSAGAPNATTRKAKTL